MQNPFLDVGYRVAAFALGVHSGRQLWQGLAERKIRSFRSNIDIFSLLLDWSARPVFERDTMPIRYWTEMGFQTFVMAMCFLAIIIGWWQPNS